MLRIDLQPHQPLRFKPCWTLLFWFDGFKVRPLRDGKGKPSPGRQPPPLRKPPSVLADLGKKTQALAAPWTTQVFDSIHKQEKVHPFPEDLLQKVRALICPTVPHHRHVVQANHSTWNISKLWPNLQKTGTPNTVLR